MHHARYDRGQGYCTFNGLVIAAHAALAAGANKVLILDLDAHCGGGTHSLIMDNPRIWHLDVSVDPYDSYECGGIGRTSLDIVGSADHYLATISRRLQACAAQRFGLCLYNAGMDPHEDSPDGSLPGIDEQVLQERERLIFSWIRAQDVPIAFVIAGGYVKTPRMSEARLVALHRLTLQAATQVRSAPS
jgi:acetoin utilization deacetylase AcuC-like enzyme